jgi:hypothetical protein
MAILMQFCFCEIREEEFFNSHGLVTTSIARVAWEVSGLTFFESAYALL